MTTLAKSPHRLLATVKGLLLHPNLRQRLTGLFVLIMVLVLTVMGFGVMGIMHRSLVSNINRDLEDTYGQLTGQNLQLGGTLGQLDAPEDGDPSPASLLLNPQLHPQGDNLSLLRRNFPNNSIQIDWTVQDSATIQQMMLHEQTQHYELALVRQTANQLRQTVGIDPNKPILLSDEQLTELLSRPDQALYLNLPVKAAFLPAERYQVLVRLADLPHRNPADGSLSTETAIIYVGRSLSGTESTLSTLRNLLLAVGLLSVLLGAVVAYILSARTLLPLLRVQKAAENINSQSLSSRVPEPTQQDEVQGLARAINRMLERLEQSFEAQRRFTSDASHELRTPVTAIKGHAGYLLRRTELTKDQREGLTIIHSEAERLSNMAQSLLDLARSDGGVMQLQLGPVFSSMLLGDIARELQPIAQAQQAKLEVLGPDEVFEADSDRLKQVLINLVSNALKAGASLVQLRSASAARPAEAPAEGSERGQGEDGVLLSVEDNGPGIAPQHLERLFDRFYRVEESRSRDQGGAGLGLAIARSIVDAHGGRIWFESELGQGTRVQVWLPRGEVALDDDYA